MGDCPVYRQPVADSVHAGASMRCSWINFIHWRAMLERDRAFSRREDLIEPNRVKLIRLDVSVQRQQIGTKIRRVILALQTSGVYPL